MNLLKVDFQELYERHLCRHSQYGNNVVHLVSVVGSYLGLFTIGYWAASFVLSDPRWVVLFFSVPYAVLLAFNVPVRVLLASLVFMAAFFALFLALAPLPIWLAPVLIVVSHFVQNAGHKIWTIERDMTRFKQKYQKGFALFVLLSLYELPILLNYVVFDVKNWSSASCEPPVSAESDLTDTPRVPA